MEQMPCLDDFLASLLWSKRSLLIVSLCTVSSTEKWWLAEKCHLNLMFCRKWWKLSTTLKYVPLTHVCSCIHEEMDAEHKRLLLHTEMRQLSKGRSLASSFELWELLQGFLLEKQSPLAAYFSDTEWVAKFAYLWDIFSWLYELNLSLQMKTTMFILAF